MGFRRKMNKRQSKRNFQKGGRTNGRNFATAMRGGYRL